MIVYDDTEPLEKLKIYDARVEVPAHYDSFAEFTYSYHYGDAYVPYIKQDEPLKLECQHFWIASGARRRRSPVVRQGLEVVRILEASSNSLKLQGQAVGLGHGHAAHSANGDLVETAEWQEQWGTTVMATAMVLVPGWHSRDVLAA